MLTCFRAVCCLNVFRHEPMLCLAAVVLQGSQIATILQVIHPHSSSVSPSWLHFTTNNNSTTTTNTNINNGYHCCNCYVLQAFLEPRADGTLPFDLSETATTTPPSQESATSARVEGKARRGRAGDPTGSPPPPQEQLALLAVRLAKVLVQSGRGVALALSRTPLLGSTKG